MCEGCAYYAKYILWNCQIWCTSPPECEITKTGTIVIITLITILTYKIIKTIKRGKE